ncbi:MAG: CATRA conflict system CASPASE/TPR repeat-associated protein [Actinomycetota bacterium]
MSALAGPETFAFVEPSLIVHAFAPLTAGVEDRTAGEDYLRSLWDACELIGMRETPLPGVGTSFTWPGTGSDTFTVLAARGAPEADARRQALLFRRHDVIGAAIALEDPAASKDLEGWRELLGTWRGCVGDVPVPDALLGETFTFLCSYDAPAATADALSPTVVGAMRTCGLEVWDAPYEPDPTIVLWDGEDHSGRRVLAVLGPLGSRDELSRQFWWAGQQELARMTRYQVHAAKLRYEERVHALRAAGLDEAAGRVERALDEVLRTHRSLDTGSTASLASAEQRLIDAQADSAGLVIQLSYLRELRRTIDIARHNLTLVASGAVAPASSATMVDRDLALATRLSEQIDHDIGYAEAVRERAQHATELSSLRLQQAEQRLQSGRSRLIVFQTALLSALLTGIGAIATFDLSLHVEEPLRLPLLASLVTLLMAAPVVAASWHDGFRPLDRLVIALFGGSVAWLAFAAARPSAPWIALAIAAAAGAAISQLLASRHPRREDVVTR